MAQTRPDFEDREAVVTPEGVAVEMVLAGLGSRFGAAVVDGLIQGVVMAALVVAAVLLADKVGGAPGEVLAAIVIVLVFVVLLGYHVVFEVLRSGRTPGKSMAGLQVVTRSGGAVTLWPSMVRNLLRLVDWLPNWYLAGVIAILASGRNQRLGDMAAGTVVIRSRHPSGASAWSRLTAEVSSSPDGWETSAVTSDELATVRTFLARRAQLDPGARVGLAWELAERLRPKVTGADPEQHPERFLEQLVAEKLSRSAT